jgi:5-(aminomethyl)-3-furanmethanol phosphate kinase
MAVNPLIVKVGGSLFPKIPELVPVFQSSRTPLLLIPGGGPFANAVRSAGVEDDSAAHWMAIAAMDQYGLYLSAHGIKTTNSPAVPETTRVLLPYCMLRELDPLPHSWDITSDTIAAWVAGYLSLDLLVLKSVDGILFNGVLQDWVNNPVDTETVDPSFIPYVIGKKIRTTVMNGTITDRVAEYLEGRSVPGTRIGTTF